jgi:selenoprotein W-related protein
MGELLDKYHPQIAEMAFHPSTGGVFEVTVNGEKLFSKKETGRYAEPGEILGLIARRHGWEVEG